VKRNKIAGIYSIVVGAAMIGMWSVFLATDSVPELHTEPIRTSFHIFIEYLTAVVLLVGGFGLLASRRWGPTAHLVSLGMLLYTVVLSPGYYAQKGDLTMVAMFAVFIALTVFFIGLRLLKEK